jgi:sugar lactone lactonase YvrE
MFARVIVAFIATYLVGTHGETVDFHVNGLRKGLYSLHHDHAVHKANDGKKEAAAHVSQHHLRTNEVISASNSAAVSTLSNPSGHPDGNDDGWVDQHAYYEYVYYMHKDFVDDKCRYPVYKYVTKLDQCYRSSDHSGYYRFHVRAHPEGNAYRSWIEFYSDPACMNFQHKEQLDGHQENILMCTYLEPNFFMMNHAIDHPLNPKYDQLGFSVLTYETHSHCASNNFLHGVIDSVYLRLGMCIPAMSAGEYDQIWTECSPEHGLVGMEFWSTDGTCGIGIKNSHVVHTHQSACSNDASSIGGYGRGWMNFVCSSVTKVDPPPLTTGTPVTLPVGTPSLAPVTAPTIPTGPGTTHVFAGTPGFNHYLGDDGPATSAYLYRPFGLWVDTVDNVYISDIMTHKIRKVDSAGIITRVAGTETNVAGFTDNVPGVNALLSEPMGMAANNDWVFFADHGNNRIRAFSRATGNLVKTVVGGCSSDCNFDNTATVRGDKWMIFSPTGIAYKSGYLVYLGGSGVYLTEMTTGTFQTKFLYANPGGAPTEAHLVQPRGIAMSANGLSVYVSDMYRIFHIDITNPTVPVTTKIAGIYNSMTSGNNGDDSRVTSVGIPTDIWLDEAHNKIYFTENLPGKIRTIDKANNYALGTFAGASAAGHTVDAGYNTAVALQSPWGLYKSPVSDRLFLADQDNQCVRVYEL